MKLTIFLLTIVFLHVSANGISQNITFSGKDVPLEKVFAEVKKQTGFVFFYDMDVVNRSAPLTLDVKDVSLDYFLRLALKGRPLKYIIQSNSVVIFPADNTPTENILPGESKYPVPVDGRITDANGNPLAGASVMIKTPTNAVAMIADQNGRFQIDAEPGTIITFSFVGYKDYQYKVLNQNKDIKIVLAQSISTMVEVSVNTGYQTIAKERSTGAFTKVQGDEIQKKSVSMNVIDRLEGMVPGLAVNYGEGNDKFIIRGINSVNSNRAPLYVLDGVPIGYDDITRLVNPNDVDNIQVLRDAMATSIWGAQAANGVIVITTKKGKMLGRIKVQYNGFVSFKGLPDYSYQKMMSPKQFINTAKEIFDPVVFPYSIVSGINPNTYQLPVIYPHEQILYDENSGLISPALANQRLDSLASLNNRSQIEGSIMQPAMLSNNSVSFTGGNAFYSFYGSLNYSNQKNNDRSDLNNYMINFQQNFNFTPFLKLDLTTNISQQNTSQFIIPNLPNLNTYLPYAMFSDANGNALSQSYMQLYAPYQLNAENMSGINLDYIPLKESAYTSRNQNSTLTARLNAGLTINFLRKFQFEGRYQYASGNNNNYTYYDQNSYSTRREVVSFTEPGPIYNLPNQGGNYFTGSGTNISWSVRNQIKYDNYWGNSQFTLLAGTEVRDNTIKTSNSLVRGYDYQAMTYTSYNEKELQMGIFDPVIPNLYSFSILSGPSYTGTETEIRFFSLYGNMAYAFKKRYNLNASLRMDQSNLFGTDVSQQYKPIWSVGGSWLISGESFFKSKSVNNLKLRLTYGINGNSPNPGSGGPYDIIYPQQDPTYYSSLGYYIIRPSNDKLTWESTATLNAGADVSILENRLSFSLDVYDKKTSNLLGNIPFDPTNGWVNGYTNLGDIRNKGFEVSIQSVNITGKNFSWMTTFNFGYNHNEVVRLGAVVPLDALGKLASVGFVQGYSAYSLFDVKWAGLNNQGNPQIYNQKGEKIMMSDQLTLDDVHYAGTSQPVVYGGMTNDLRYKAFDLSFLIVYNFGNVMRSYTNQYYSGRLTNNVVQYFDDRWKKPGDENKTNIPSYVSDPVVDVATRYTAFYNYADINIESASYIKLRDITLGYNLPASWISKLSMEGVKIYAQVNNILLWAANDQGIDPEYYNLNSGPGVSQGAGTGSSLGGAPPANIPNRMKAFFTFGLNVSFK